MTSGRKAIQHLEVGLMREIQEESQRSLVRELQRKQLDAVDGLNRRPAAGRVAFPYGTPATPPTGTRNMGSLVPVPGTGTRCRTFSLL